jgi:hypothetical protein
MKQQQWPASHKLRHVWHLVIHENIGEVEHPRNMRVR